MEEDPRSSGLVAPRWINQGYNSLQRAQARPLTLFGTRSGLTGFSVAIFTGIRLGICRQLNPAPSKACVLLLSACAYRIFPTPRAVVAGR